MEFYTNKERSEQKTRQAGTNGDTPHDLTRPMKGSTGQALKIELGYSFEERSSEQRKALLHHCASIGARVVVIDNIENTSRFGGCEEGNPDYSELHVEDRR